VFITLTVFGAAKLGIGKCATTDEDKTTKEKVGIRGWAYPATLPT